MTLAFACVLTVVLFLIPGVFVEIFSKEPAVIATGVAVVLMYAAFQPFDGLQVVATGALRGLGETRTPMLANLGYHWLIGLPLAYYLCFNRDWGVVGLWAGLSTSLVLVGITLVAAWHRRSVGFAARHRLAG